MPFMGYPGYPMAYGYPMASQPVAGSATAQQPAPQMMTYQAPQYMTYQAPSYLTYQAPQMMTSQAPSYEGAPSYGVPQPEYQVGCLSSRACRRWDGDQRMRSGGLVRNSMNEGKDGAGRAIIDHVEARMSE